MIKFPSLVVTLEFGNRRRVLEGASLPPAARNELVRVLLRSESLHTVIHGKAGEGGGWVRPEDRETNDIQNSFSVVSEPGTEGGCGREPSGNDEETLALASHLDRDLREKFSRLKDGKQVVYPLHGQLRLLMDAFAVGEQRPFGLEGLAADPLFVHLAGGCVPSLDTVYRDLCRFDGLAIRDLEGSVASQGLFPLMGLRRKSNQVVHLAGLRCRR